MPRLAFRPLAGAAALIALVVLPSAVSAQDSREHELAAARAEKATNLRPYEAQGLERQIERLDGLMFANKRAFYPFIGSTFEGSGLAIGPGYRTNIGDTGRFNAFATWSYRNYKSADATFGLPTFANNRVSVQVNGHWIDAPSVTFYGVGPDSSKDLKAGYAFTVKSVGAAAKVRAAGPLVVGGGMDILDTEAGPARGALVPTVNPTYRRSRAFAEVDTRTSPDYTRTGGLYRVELSDYHQTNASDFSFRRLDAEAQQYIPFGRENWVIALRALASTTDAAAGQDVPYFLMPELGGSHLLRGFSSWRFRDRNRMLLSGEYRWSAGPFVDMSVFMDAGKVAPRLADLNFDDLETSRGIGVSFHTPHATVLRAEVARSREGTSLILSFSPAF